MTLDKCKHKSHHSFLAFGRARHGIQIGETVPESERFEGADVGHKVDSTAMGWLKRSMEGFLENNQHECGQKVEKPTAIRMRFNLGSQEGAYTCLP
ncbi:MAG: hypothetical protein NTX35_01050 [Verrucomicrobia bacterium]|nr:hypothetical protein [Verrucomicrobiota bacterium]